MGDGFIMVCEYTSGLSVLTHIAERQIYSMKDWSRKRLLLNTTAEDPPPLLLKTTKHPEGDIIDNRYPMSAIVTSPPIFINAESFDLFDPHLPVVGEGGTRAIEFRTASDFTMSDATPWESVNPNGSPSGFNHQNLDVGGDFKGPLNTNASSVIASTLVSGVSIDATSPNAEGEVVYYSRASLVSGLTATSELIGDYIVAEVKCSKQGPVAELVVLHGVEFDSSEDDIREVKAPFKHLINIDYPDSVQTVYWDITDWPDGERNIDYIRALGVKILDGIGDFTLDIDNFRLYNIADPSVSEIFSIGFPATPNKFIQYRVIISTTDKSAVQPDIDSVSFTYNRRKTIIPNSVMRHGKCIDTTGVNYPTRNGMTLEYS